MSRTKGAPAAAVPAAQPFAEEGGGGGGDDDVPF
jgi:hypothetical protein